MKDKQVGTVVSAQLHREVNGNKYYSIYINEKISKSLDLEHKELARIKIRNQEGSETEFTKKVYRHKNDTFKFSVPTQEGEELGVTEGDLLDLFISKP